MSHVGWACFGHSQPSPSLLHIPQGLGVGVMMAVGCQAVVVAVALENRVKEGDLLEEHVNLRTQLQEWMLAVYIW